MKGPGSGPRRGSRPGLPATDSPSPAVTAHARALDALARRARSSTELSRWLRDHDYPPDEIDETIARLTAAGLLDDASFARSFVRSRLVDRKLSRRRVQAELARRGVARALVDAALTEVMADEDVDEEATVRAVAERKYRSLAGLERDVARRRLLGFLSRRGYEGEMVRKVVAEVMR